MSFASYASETKKEFHLKTVIKKHFTAIYLSTRSIKVTYSSQKITFISVNLDKFLSLRSITDQTQKYLVHCKT